MASAFSETRTCKLTFDANGLPNGVTAAAKEDVVSGTIKGITSLFTGDEVVVGLGRTLATAVVGYGAAQYARKRATGAFAFNPWQGN